MLGGGLPTTITVATDGNQTKLFQGLSLTITATVMHVHGGSTGVTWSLSGANCPNNCGSLSTTSANPLTYTAPQTVSANFTVIHRDRYRHRRRGYDPQGIREP